MPPSIDNSVKTDVIKPWLDGDTRDKIADGNQIGASTVSGIINEWKKGIDVLEYDSFRELSVSCKKQGIIWARLLPLSEQIIMFKNQAQIKTKLKP